ncbi:MAG: hypothetical protein AUI11_07125 [Acidobacteria bacterium 13_2_20CM_2_66_4]|nr:MAG: hypothetical protein AUI11_07125 [Acidobacteria bacterium 13_2_20CM_2_66_4]
MNLMNLMNTRTCAAAVVVAVISLLAGPGESQIPNPESQAAAGTRGQQPVLGYDDTPMQPNGRWRIHSAWQNADGSKASWAMKSGILETGKGMIHTKTEFTDLQLHVEFATPSAVKGDSQERGNSGVFLLGKFEIQVLDSYRNPTYPDGQAAAMYGQYPPLVNASRKPGEWQAYDIVFTAPRLARGGTLDKPAIVTVFHNGIVVHNATPFWGPTAHKKIEPYTPDTAKGPIALQDHGNPVRYRNVWIRAINGYDSAT